MQNDDQKRLHELLHKMFTDWLNAQNGGGRDRYCQRCEEPRKGNQFTTNLPVCDVCVDTMPAKELNDLANSLK